MSDNPYDPHTEAELHEQYAAATGLPTADDEYMAELSAEADAALAEQQAKEAHERAVADVLQRLRARREAEQRLRADTRPPVPAAYTLRQLMALAVPEVRYRVEEIWPAGTRIMLAATAKAGKTTMRDNLARVLVDGGQFLDKFSVQPSTRRVGIIDTELDTVMLQRWLGDQRIQNQDALWVQPLRGYVATFDLLDDDCRAAWARRLRAADVGTLILDCLGPVLAAFGLDENSNVDAGRWLLAYEQLLTDAGVEDAALVHHFGHNAERGRGASRLQDWPDVLWRLVRAEPKPGEPADPLRYFSAAGRDVDLPEGALRNDPIDRHLAYTGGSRRRAEIERDIPIVVDFLTERDGSADHALWSITEIEQASPGDIGRNRSRRAVDEAIRRNILCKHRGGARRYNIHVHAQCAECAATRRGESADEQGALFDNPPIRHPPL